MKKLFLFMYTVMCMHGQLQAQNTSYDSAAVLIGGVNNVGIGIGVLKVNAGLRNVGVGIGALENSGVASDNTAIGYHAMNESVGTFYNTAVGKEALKKNQSQYNTALGWGAMVSNIGGESNTATGGLALGLNAGGSFNTANGFLSLYNNTNGDGNTGIGSHSLYTNQIGNYNTATGRDALYNNTGSYNTANGYKALLTNTTGYYNTATGFSSLYFNTVGESNTATGHGALYFNTTGSRNTATGLLALHQNITGEQNTAIGWQSLYSNLTGNNNTAIGYFADVATDGLTNATAIGFNAKVTESNAIQLGNAAVTKVFSGVGNNATFITGGLQVTGGIPVVGKVLTSDATGVATWQTPVTGVGGSGTLNYVSKFTPDGVTLGNSQIFDNGTSIGIGTASPVAKLDITGNIKIADGTQGTGKVLTSDANGLATWQTPASGGGAGWLLTGNAGTVDVTNFIGTTDNVPFNIRVNNRPAARIEGVAGQNTFYGFESGLLNTGNGNVGYGFKALTANTTGIGNTSVGLASMSSNTTGSNNTASGASALLLNTTGNNNTAYGYATLVSSNTNNNTAIGFRALSQNFSGDENTAVGSAALYNNITGRRNTALGDSADVASVNLSNATALGYRAIVQQSNSIQLGNNAVTKIFAGVGNTATIVTGGLQVTGGSPGVGKVLTSNATGIATWQIPAATPSWSLTGNAGTVDGTNFIGTTDNVPFNIKVNNQKSGRIESNINTANTFFGYLSGSLNSNGGYNTAIGYSTLASSTGSSGNTATGAFALSANTNAGNYNSAFGGEALTSNLGGSFNTAIGNSAMLNNRNGGRNTAIGVEALRNNINGGRNTAVGISTLVNNISGDFNTAVGFNAGVGGSNFTNATAIGTGALAASSDRVTLGNLSVTVVEGKVAYTLISDGRFKNNISESDVKGLEFITKLRPVVYNLDSKKLQKHMTKNMPDSISKIYLDQDFGPSTSIRQSGFIAQEVEKAAEEVGYSFNGVRKPANENDHYSLAYSQFVVPLVKAVQEQQKMIEDLQKQVKQLQQQNSLAETLPAVSAIELADNNAVVLNQNIPNPFAQQTSISYNIPVSANSAQIIFYSLEGRLMKTANITTRGKGILNVFASDLSSGSYTYSLMIDGKILDTKKLVKQ